MALRDVHVLLRRLGPLAAPDRILGVFPSLDAAREARTSYLAQAKGESWEGQIRGDLELEKNVWVDSTWSVDAPDDVLEVFLVSSVSQDFDGSTEYRINGVTSTWEAAEALSGQVVERLVQKAENDECAVTAAELGKLLPEVDGEPGGV